ncbi:chemoreceptor-like protein with four helix bundle sensory module [Larkinella arboricola]|uniref:Chemoreceptor-like protein with four helix bundle sensory module n=1 Tax=Larkinella arboricola TaxID=643671 RepID=A0A327WQR6_LARAB|nr:MCP four helix bundle domain-containing protein [Larkinella arboricola]RAJ94260.1 chemoreceptor-like protein with four helix bundle sensory module [Larkinella arboricola]
MKWSFIIQQKLKAAVLLTSIMALVVLCSFLSNSAIKHINQSFSSIYQDRLIPAVDMVYLSENLYTKRLSLEKYLFSNTDVTLAQVSEQLHRRDRAIDSLLRDVEKTFLVAEEAKSLHTFKNHVKDYTVLENRILQLSQDGQKEAGHALFNGRGAAMFQESIQCLNALTRIQSTVGRSLMNESQSESSQFNLLSSLQISVAIIIGLVILGLIYNSKMITQEKQPFHLN